MGFTHEMEVVVGPLVEVSSKTLVTSQPLGVPLPAWVQEIYAPRDGQKIPATKDARLNQTFAYQVSARLFQQRVPWAPHPLGVFEAGLCAPCHLPCVMWLESCVLISLRLH